MRERAVKLGRTSSLIGVITEPRSDRNPARPAIIFLNSGILHHVGACRLHVRLARRLAALGFTSLRFDLSGIGDSEARKDSLTFEQSALLEVQEAMDYVTSATGAREFILIGLCSGADMGFNVSQADPRVIGLVQLDAYAYRTPGYYLRYYTPRVLSLTTWSNFIKRKLGKASGYTKGPAPGEDYVRPEYRRRFPPQDVVASGLRTLVSRGVNLLFLFSGGQPDHYNHRKQYASSFSNIDFGELLQVEYWGDADHLFSDLRHQQLVDAAIADWVARTGARVSAQSHVQAEPDRVEADVKVPATASASAFRIRA